MTESPFGVFFASSSSRKSTNVSKLALTNEQIKADLEACPSQKDRIIYLHLCGWSYGEGKAVLKSRTKDGDLVDLYAPQWYQRWTEYQKGSMKYNGPDPKRHLTPKVDDELPEAAD